MIPNRVSIIVPSRNEKFLVPTVNDLLTKHAGDIEIIVVLDGYWPNPPLPESTRLRVLHRGRAHGMRPAINAAASLATGQYLMKLDAHCMVEEGFDDVLRRDCDADWIVVPRRDRLDAEQWCKQRTGKPPIDAHYLSYPFERPDDPSCGLHGTIWPERARERKHVAIDDEMSSQGSCWFMHTRYFIDRIWPLDVANYGNFIAEFQEVGLKCWLSGGKVKVNKGTTYYHLHKGKRHGRGYFLSKSEQSRGSDFSTRFWMLDQWPKRTHDLRWLVERFAPVPTWPDDLDRAFAIARAKLAAAA